MSKNIFITGTGTDVGKTFVSALIVKKLRESGYQSAYFKAAMSGNERDDAGNLIPGDAVYVKNISQIDQPVNEMCPYNYEHGVSPHLAARLEGNPVEMKIVQSCFQTLNQKYDYVTVEGSGGIFCPIRWDETEIQMEDVIKGLDLSCLIVADAGLGTINAVCLTAAYMKSKSIPVKGIIFNRFQPDHFMHRDNLDMCQRMTGLKVIACVQEGQQDLDISPQALCALYEEKEEGVK